MTIACPACGASMPDISGFCPACGKVVHRQDGSAGAGEHPAAAVEPTTLQTRILAGLAYVAVLPAVIFLLVNPFKRDRFVRFHALQSLLFVAAVVATAVLLRLISLVLLILPGFGLLFTLLMLTIVAIGLGIVWLLLVVKALQGEPFRLGLIGQLAERYA